MVVTYSKSSMDQPGKVANPARGQPSRGNEYFPVRVRAWEFDLARRVRQSCPASACSSPYQAESGAYLRGSSRVPRRRPFIYFKPAPYAIGSVPSLSGHTVAYRWRSLPRVRRHRACSPYRHIEYGGRLADTGYCIGTNHVETCGGA